MDAKIDSTSGEQVACVPGCIIKPTVQFRWKRRTASRGLMSRTLQQLYIGVHTGEHVWRDVPVVDEIIDSKVEDKDENS